MPLLQEQNSGIEDWEVYEAYGGEADHTKSMFKYEEDQELEVK